MMQEYVAKATLRCIMGSQLCTQILLNFYKTCCQAKFIKNFYSVLHSGPIFYTVRLYVMNKTSGGCLKE